MAATKDVIEAPLGKKFVEMNLVKVVNKPEEELINHDVPIGRLQQKNEELFDEMTEETKSVVGLRVPSSISEEPTNIQEWNLERPGPEDEGSRRTAPWLLALERAEEFITLVKSSIKMMMTIPAGKYLTTVMNMFDLEQ